MSVDRSFFHISTNKKQEFLYLKLVSGTRLRQVVKRKFSELLLFSFGWKSRFPTKKPEKPWRKNPEIINDESPLIRDGQSNVVKPITTGRIHSVVHNLYVKAGLITSNPRGRRYDLRAHSIRKFYRMQLASFRSPNRLHRVHDGPYNQHLPRHTHERHRIPPRNLHFIRTKHKT
jgi:hypothetical protein